MMIRFTLIDILVISLKLPILLCFHFHVAHVSEEIMIAVSNVCKVAPITETKSDKSSSLTTVYSPKWLSYLHKWVQTSQAPALTPLSRLDLTLHIITFRRKSPHDGTRGSSLAPADRFNRLPSKSQERPCNNVFLRAVPTFFRFW